MLSGEHNANYPINGFLSALYARDQGRTYTQPIGFTLHFFAPALIPSFHSYCTPPCKMPSFQPNYCSYCPLAPPGVRVSGRYRYLRHARSSCTEFRHGREIDFLHSNNILPPSFQQLSISEPSIFTPGSVLASCDSCACPVPTAVSRYAKLKFRLRCFLAWLTSLRNSKSNLHLLLKSYKTTRPPSSISSKDRMK